jgi:hypothetical protein
MRSRAAHEGGRNREPHGMAPALLGAYQPALQRAICVWDRASAMPSRKPRNQAVGADGSPGGLPVVRRGGGVVPDDRDRRTR